MKTATPEKNGLVDRSGTDLIFGGMALNLERAVRTKNKLYSKPDPEYWAKQFEALHNTDGATIPEIQTVLAWYISNLGKPFVPQAYSANGFRRKYRQIMAAMKRASTDIAPTQMIREFRTGLALVWPRDDERADEMKFLQLTYDRYGKYLEKLHTLREREAAADAARKQEQKNKLGVVTSSTDELAGLAAYIFANSPAALDFTEGWARRVNRLATVWDKWPGGLLNFSWHPANPFWTKQMQRLAAGYCGEQNDGWGKILSHIEH